MFNPTPTETEVLKLMVRGLTGSQIAGRLCRSPRTIETHRKNLWGKARGLGFDNLAEYAEHVNVIRIIEVEEQVEKQPPVLNLCCPHCGAGLLRVAME